MAIVDSDSEDSGGAQAKLRDRPARTASDMMTKINSSRISLAAGIIPAVTADVTAVDATAATAGVTAAGAAANAVPSVQLCLLPCRLVLAVTRLQEEKRRHAGQPFEMRPTIVIHAHHAHQHRTHSLRPFLLQERYFTCSFSQQRRVSTKFSISQRKCPCNLYTHNTARLS